MNRDEIIVFDLIKIAENSYCIDPNSFEMYGAIGFGYIEDFFNTIDTWGADMWTDAKHVVNDTCSKTVTLKVFIDSDDFTSWLDYEVLDPADTFATAETARADERPPEVENL